MGAEDQPKLIYQSMMPLRPRFASGDLTQGDLFQGFTVKTSSSLGILSEIARDLDGGQSTRLPLW
jgi:hypothetical protein